MSAEHNLKQRLAAIVKVASADPFAKVASADAQLAMVTEAVLERKPAAKQEAAPIQKVASITDFTMSELFKHEEFRKGFSSVLEARGPEIEASLRKVAELKK